MSKAVNECNTEYCETVQPINDTCVCCNKKMGNYFCRICKLLQIWTINNNFIVAHVVYAI